MTISSSKPFGEFLFVKDFVVIYFTCHKFLFCSAGIVGLFCHERAPFRPKEWLNVQNTYRFRRFRSAARSASSRSRSVSEKSTKLMASAIAGVTSDFADQAAPSPGRRGDNSGGPGDPSAAR